MSQLREWEDPLVVGRNRRPMHVPLGACIPMPPQHWQAPAGKTGGASRSPFMHSLNGDWKFYLAPTPADAPPLFFADDYDDAAWVSIPVPSNWQLPAVALPGFKDNPIYANVHYTFEPRAAARPPSQPNRLLPDDVHLGTPCGRADWCCCCLRVWIQT